MNLLQQLQTMTTVVADTGEFAQIAKYRPQDSTTNPTLILQAVRLEQYAPLLAEVISQVKPLKLNLTEKVEEALDRILIAFGVEILKLVPGRVSTEVDARLSFDTQKSIAKAHKLISMYEKAGIPRKRVLIKLASTWEGILAAKELQKEGIFCNMTLLFSVAQAAACCEVGATLVSPFVGRILDWYKKHDGVDSYPAEKDPGVLSVREIYQYIKKFGYKTEVMGASFRNEEEIIALAGCDLLTISPKFLQKLASMEGTLERKLDPSQASKSPFKKMELNESAFRFDLNENAMATEKLSEGIRLFARDAIALEEMIQHALQS